MILLAGIALPGVGSAQAPSPGRLALDDVMRRLGFEDDAGGELRAGEIVAVNLDSENSDELAVMVAMLVEAPAAEVFRRLRSGLMLRVDDVVSRAIELPEGSEAPWPPFGLDGTDEDEFEMLLEIEPGDEFNLSPAEINRFRASIDRTMRRRGEGDPAVQRRLNDVYRQILQRRLAAYRRAGLAAVAPYARDDDEVVSPAESLRAAAETETMLEAFAPALHRAWLAYPDLEADGIDNRFHAIELDAEDRPTLVLSHWMVQSPETAADTATTAGFLVERQFYVGHSYDCLQAVTGCFAVEEGTLLVQRNRTFTQQVTGLTGGARRPLGRRHLRQAVATTFEAVRDHLDQ